MSVQSANSRWGALVSTSPPIQCTAVKIGHKINERSDCDRSTQQPLVPPPRSSFLIGNSDFLPDQIKISLAAEGRAHRPPGAPSAGGAAKPCMTQSSMGNAPQHVGDVEGDKETPPVGAPGAQGHSDHSPTGSATGWIHDIN